MKLRTWNIVEEKLENGLFSVSATSRFLRRRNGTNAKPALLSDNIYFERGSLLTHDDEEQQYEEREDPL
jgi:hypothetical protein